MAEEGVEPKPQPVTYRVPTSCLDCVLIGLPPSPLPDRGEALAPSPRSGGWLGWKIPSKERRFYSGGTPE